MTIHRDFYLEKNERVIELLSLLYRHKHWLSV